MSDMPGPEDVGRPNGEGDVLADKFAIRISVTPETITELLRRFDLEVGDRPHVEPTSERLGTLHAFAPEEQIRLIEAAGYTVEVGENVSETGRQRMAEISKGDRFEGGRVPPRGLGRKPRRHEGSFPDPEKGGQTR